MKRTFLFLFSLAYIFGAEPKQNLDAAYTKALIDLANAQAMRIALPDSIKKAEQDTNDALAKAQAALQGVLQEKSKECAAMTPPQRVDDKSITEKGVLTCTAQETPKK